MKIAIDASPLTSMHYLQHRARGTGFYIENLKSSLLKYFTDNKYIFFTRGENLPKDIDLVHYPYFEPFFLTLPIFRKYKTVVTVHDLTPLVFKKYFPVGIRGRFKWEIQKLALQSVDAIIADSESSKRDIIQFADVPSSKINVIYLAAGEEFRKCQMSNVKCQMFKNKYRLPDKFVLYVGDVTWNKNLPRLVEAIKKINVTLVMVGSALARRDFDRTNPWNQDLLKVLKFTEDDKRIIKLGFVPMEDLVTIYNLATVFVMPSLYEGFGLPILEAMSCGCPVITTNEGSLKEVAGDAAYFIDAYDTANIASGIKKVFEDKSIQKSLSDKGLFHAKKFTWKKTAEETFRVYSSFAKRSGF